MQNSRGDVLEIVVESSDELRTKLTNRSSECLRRRSMISVN